MLRTSGRLIKRSDLDDSQLCASKTESGQTDIIPMKQRGLVVCENDRSLVNSGTLMLT